MQTPEDKLDRALNLACDAFPYLQSALLSFIRHPMAGLKTLGCTKDFVLYYDPDVVTEWTEEHLITVLGHEAFHPTLGHFDRMGERIPKIWNLAGDAEINGPLVGFRKFPDSPILPSTVKAPDNLTAEEYYPYFLANTTIIKINGPGSGQCGSCAGQPDPDGVPNGLTEPQKENIRSAVANAAVEQNNKEPGSVPGSIVVWAGGYLKPSKIRWQDKLLRSAKRTISNRLRPIHYTQQKQPRRWHALRSQGFVLPIMSTKIGSIPNIVIGQDVSGSMMGGDLEKCFSEIVEIIKCVGCPVEVVGFDCTVQKAVKVKSKKDLVKVGESGGGGTDMGAAVMECASRNPTLIVLMTDGYTGWHTPKQALMVPPVLVVCTTDEAIPEYVGEVVRVDKDA